MLVLGRAIIYLISWFLFYFVHGYIWISWICWTVHYYVALKAWYDESHKCVSKLKLDWAFSGSAVACTAQHHHIATSVITARVFSLDPGFFCFIWGFYWKSGFFWLRSNFIDVCCITVFSIQEYSSFTGVICAESVACTDVTNRARLNQIVCNLKWFTD